MAYISTDDDEIQVANIDKAQYPLEVVSTDPFQKLRDGAHFINYFLCGYKAILAHDDELKKKMEGKKPKGMKILIDSHVPPAAGLSSSSAYTVCAAVTTMHANGLT